MDLYGKSSDWQRAKTRLSQALRNSETDSKLLGYIKIVQYDEKSKLKMTENSHSNIRQLKEKLVQARQAFEKHKRLIAKREEIDETLEKLNQEHDILLYRLYQNPDWERIDPHAFQQHSRVLENKQNLLSELKQKKQEIDIWLDESEELTPERLEFMQEELVSQILALEPFEAQSMKQAQIQRFKNLSYLTAQLDRTNGICLRLHELLTDVLATRQSIKGLGLLNYIFGTSPNWRIEKHFEECHRVAQLTLPLLKQDIEHCPDVKIKSLLIEIQQFLEELDHHFMATWGFRHIDTIFKEAHQRLDQNLKQIQLYVLALAEEQERLEDEIESWSEFL